VTQPDAVKVSIVIKALNEEEYIENSIRSALAAIECIGGEVILAGSISTDNTVGIARQFPVTIVQLKNIEDRRCGAGPQLGYQLARGQYVYILDGDMEMDPDFLPVAIEAMENDPELGGVGGLVDEQSSASYQFRGRKRRKSEGIPGEVKWLDMGGLYRRQALEQVHYFSNRNLHAYEEQDLGLRLKHAGWNLCRLPVRSVLHHGYSEGNWVLLKRRWRSRYLDGGGEILRTSLGKSYFRDIAWQQKHLFVGLGLWVGLIAGLLLLPFTSWPLVATGLLLVALVTIRASRIGSLSDAIFAQVVWQVTSLAMVRGFLASSVDPRKPIEKVVLNRPGLTGDSIS